MGQQPLPIGIDDFQKLRKNGYYYVDKSILIKELLDKKGEVNLFNRPRRFGKTLNMSMLRYFFEIDKEKENIGLFDGLAILDAGDNYRKQMGKYPVVMLSLKSAKQSRFSLAYSCLKEEISREFKRYLFIVESPRMEIEKERYLRIAKGNGGQEDYLTSLRFLSDCLCQFYKQKVIILIDEYDVPLENAYFEGFYKEMADFIRSLFESALKTNPSLEFSVITGCLRISKESIFTGMNNLEINSILSKNYGEYFGFTGEEIEGMLETYQCREHMNIVTDWYDGYLFGNSEVYNPWSILNYIKEVIADSSALPRPYWANTSSNQVVKALIDKAGLGVKQELEILIAGGTIEKPVHEDITYEDVYCSENNLWNFLFFTGYLKKISEKLKDDSIFITLMIPNREVRYLYKHTIQEWFERRIGERNLRNLYQAFFDGDEKRAGNLISEELADSISFFDSGKESFYHGFLLGLLKNMDRYLILSNRETGDGRADIVIQSPSIKGSVIIMELKIAESYDQLENRCREALDQIQMKKYVVPFEKEGYQNIKAYGIAFYKKDCMVMQGDVKK